MIFFLTLLLLCLISEQRRQNLLLESLCVYFLNLLQLHIKEIKLSKVWSKILHYLHTYPFNPRILSSVIGVGTLYTVPQKIRRVLDEFSQRYLGIVINFDLLAHIPGFILGNGLSSAYFKVL